MNSHKSFTRSIISRLGKMAYESSASLLAVRNRAFRTHLSQVIQDQFGKQDSVFSDPVIEPTFGWMQSSENLQNLNDSGRLSTTLFRNLTNPHHEFREDYTFPADRKPYEHQLQAWGILGSPEPQSLLVTSGTGSGKTETFMIPILDDLARQIERKDEQLIGVQALFLYPLNALIESQKSRLAAWSEGMGGKLRFALYTGSMEDEIRSTGGYACEVPDRKRLREAPPPLLITNMTMLEYMLIRGSDAPILEKSQGKLKWIVLDEAHTHIGSNAAEVALLLRRTLHAFGVTADRVRFVATSATFGNDPDSLYQLRCFLADMGGIHPDRVNVVTGQRNIPALPSTPAANNLGIGELEAIEPELENSRLRYEFLAGNHTALAIRNHFLTSTGPNQSTRPGRVIGSLLARVPELHGEDTHGVLRWLDLMSSTKDAESNAFLPFRLHLFQRSLSGLSCCVNPQCSFKSDALRQPDWSYGQVWLDSRSSCGCGSPVLSMVRCRECSEVMLSGQQVIKVGGPRLESRRFFVVDEFELDDNTVSDDAEVDTNDAPDGQSAGKVPQVNNATPLLVTPAQMAGQAKYKITTEQRFLTKGSHVLGDDLIEGQEQISLRIGMLGSDMYRCPCCLKRASMESRIFAPLRISATFAVSNTVGTLLETCPPASGVSDGSTFFEGRKLIAFNDSRQGTAQLALRVRLRSERAYLRSFVYDQLLKEHLIQPAGGLTDEQQNEYVELSARKAAGALSFFENKYLNSLEELLQPAGRPVSMPWLTIVGRMVQSPRFTKILELYRDDGFRIEDPTLLASVMLRREFQRRPKNANNLESMGLVCLSYPGINHVTKTPEKWRGNLQEYKDYLKLMVDFLVRESSAVQMTKAEQDLVGQKILNKAIMPPSVLPDGLKSSQVRWPQVDPENSGKRQSRPIRLLCLAFGYKPQSISTDVVDMNGILQQAFNDLVNRGVLLQADAASSEYRLDLTRSEFSIILKAWKCPVTNRLLDTTLKGITPYASGPDSPYMAASVEMPVYPRPLAQAANLLDRLAHARAWLEDNPVIQALRDEFFWSDLSDGVIEYTDFFNAREHSAQVSKSSLKKIVEGFDRGTVNFLSCSTTMEMGVDLSGFNTVMNNNVPPHPANYLQRAGRAGRRRESQAVVMTVARNTPHDQGVFMNPLWAFEKRVAVPAVRFDSDELVLRHVSSWLLGYFLKLQQLTGMSTKLTTGGFLLLAGRPESLGETFTNWVRHVSTASTEDAVVKQAIILITRGTCLQGFSVGSMGQRIVLLYRSFSENWLRTHSVLKAQLIALTGNSSPSLDRMEGDTPAISALRHQIVRLEGEFLLKDLAASKVLPTFGFPSDIVTFNNANKLDYERSRWRAAQEDPERKDSLLRKNGLPSRSRAIAIREYAPGNELVIDGKVYRSAGLTLNWKVPAQDADGELREQQQLKSAWRCHSCGASDSSVTYAPEHCTQCNEMLRPQNTLRYIVPNGFAVDFDIAPTLNIEESRQMPVRDPWLSVNKPWVPLGNGKSGALRMATDAHLFFHSDGLHQNGYALCLQCGRMDSMKPVDPSSDPYGQDTGRYLPDLFRRPHRKLRGDKKKDRNHDGFCEGSDNSWKIMPKLGLGHDTKTSALEMALRLPDGTPLHDDTVAYTIGLALRNVIAGEFGVIPDEIGVSTKEVRLADGKYSLVQVFDLGSGSYCTSYSGLHLRDTWKKVQAQLANCPGGCMSSCFNCLLTFENRFKADSIDRLKGLEIITDGWIEGFVLPNEISSHRDGFEFISLEPFGWLREGIDRGGRATLCFGGNPSEWDLALATKIRNLAESAEASGLTIELRMATKVPEELDEANAFQLLQVLANQPAIELALSDKDPTLSSVAGWWIFAQIEVAGKATVLLTNQSGAVIPDWQWASAGSGGIMVAGPAEGIHLAATSRKLNATLPRPGTVFVRDELDGRIDSFGSKFWQLLVDRHALVNEIFNGNHGHVVRIEYSDRYFRSPLVMALFCEVLSGMKLHGLMGDGAIKVVVRLLERATSENSFRSPHLPFHDFTGDTKLCAVLSRVLQDCGFNPDIDIRASIEHCRILQVHLADGSKLSIILDQGFGAWQLVPDSGKTYMPRLDFNKSIDGLSEEIYGAKWFVSINSGGRTYIVPEVSTPR